MSTIAIAQSPIAPVFQDDPGTIVHSKVCGVALASGDPAYEDATTGKMLKASSETSAATAQFAGLVLEAKGIGQATALLSAGEVGGFDLSGLAYGALVYLNDGVIGTTAGTHSVVVGRVVASAVQDSTGALRKLLKISVNNLVTIA